MKKSGVLVTVASFAVVGILYANSQYELAKDMNDFPVAKAAQLIQAEETESRKSYDWSAASGDNGIPVSYKLILRKNGWHQGQIDGTKMSL